MTTFLVFFLFFFFSFKSFVSLLVPVLVYSDKFWMWSLFTAFGFAACKPRATGRCILAESEHRCEHLLIEFGFPSVFFCFYSCCLLANCFELIVASHGWSHFDIHFYISLFACLFGFSFSVSLKLSVLISIFGMN